VDSPEELEEIWPNWSEGIPTRIRKVCYNPSEDREYFETFEFKWRGPYMLSQLKTNVRLLPSGDYESEWGGVYRIFSPNTTIDRCCGNDPTGTLYLAVFSRSSG
jgi:hypothetical protein